MAKPNPKVLLSAAAAYLKDHPEEILRAARGAVALRVGVPLAALRYVVANFLRGDKAPRDVVVEASPPGLRAAATVSAMGATLRASLVAYVDEIEFGAERALLTVRIADMAIDVLDGEDTPVGGLVKSGALDLSKPGNLVAFMPKRPEMLVDAEDDRLVVDLLKIPKIANHRKARRALRVLTPVVGVAAIRTKDDHLDVHLQLKPGGWSDAVHEVRRAG
ncbi:MAG: hypothetical protein JRI23_33135 [Deltaproteobacteria bacterium]|jgi:hypothetical protein|nr:hypothetical protein [Deltaproteobacteria bacterium]MBW2537099.1 hypothetical protein [Deltaproteobacteria bacterium]